VWSNLICCFVFYTLYYTKENTAFCFAHPCPRYWIIGLNNISIHYIIWYYYICRFQKPTVSIISLPYYDRYIITWRFMYCMFWLNKLTVATVFMSFTFKSLSADKLNDFCTFDSNNISYKISGIYWCSDSENSVLS